MTMAGRAILFSEMVPDPSWETGFNAWYDEEHVPDRMVLPGFLGAQRYRAENGTYLVVYEMESLQALATPGYDKVKTQPSERTRWMLGAVDGFTRNLGTAVGGSGEVTDALGAPHGIRASLFDVPPEQEDAFDQWMVDQRIPASVEAKACLAARLFRLTVAEPERFSRLLIEYFVPPEALVRDLSEGPDLPFALPKPARVRTFRSWGRFHRATGSA